VIYMLDTDMDNDMDSQAHDCRRDGGRGPESQHVELGAWSLEQVDLTRILSFLGYGETGAGCTSDHDSSPAYSSNGIHSTTNSGVSNGRGGERIRERAIRIDGAAGAVSATEIDGAGEDAMASSLHPRLLDHDSDKKVKHKPDHGVRDVACT
jgi:hypothetical protein